MSILVAARNEEQNILRCLRALAAQQYPADRFEVLLGDDMSTDRTAPLAKDFTGQHPRFHLFTIQKQVPGLRGKANVLAQLARRAKGQYLFFTDADVAVNPHWLQNMLQYTGGGREVVTGCSVVQPESLLTRLQGIDWVYAQGMVTFVSWLGLPVTSMGNNMLISRKAYLATGGYENFPFSITEDYELFRQAVGRGFGFKNVMNRRVLAETRGATTIPWLLQQRKRWMYGAMQLPWHMLGLLMLQALFFPLLVVLVVLNPALGLAAWLGKMLVQAVIVAVLLVKLKQKTLLWALPLYEPYLLLISTAMIVYYYLPIAVDWKGRKYKV